ncbi:hypothetical protein FGB62_140g122 [Gracilaria domingensis]|nr:hypothetical protein FGB62_140g122 [Gracilaria domingensis]
MSIRELPEDVLSVIIDKWKPLQKCVQIKHFASFRELNAIGTLMFSKEFFSKMISEYIRRTVTCIDFVTDNVIRPELHSSVLCCDKLRVELFNYHAEVVEFLCSAAAKTETSRLRTLKLRIVAESKASRDILLQVGACVALQEIVVFQSTVEDEQVLERALVELPNLKKVHISSASKVTLRALSQSRSNVEVLRIRQLDVYSTHEFERYLSAKGRYLKHLEINGYASVTSRHSFENHEHYHEIEAERCILRFLFCHAKTYMPKLATLEVALISDMSDVAGCNFLEAMCDLFSGYADLVLRWDSIGSVFYFGKNADRKRVFREMEFSANAFQLLRIFPSALEGLSVFHLRSSSSMSEYALSSAMRNSANTLIERSKPWLKTIECKTCPAVYESSKVVFGFLSGVLEHSGTRMELQCSASILKHFKIEASVRETHRRAADHMHKLQSVQLFRRSAAERKQCEVALEEDIKNLEGVPYFLQLVHASMPGLEKITFSKAPASVCQCCKKRLKRVLEDAILAVHNFSRMKRSVDISDLYSELFIWWRNCD